MPTGRGGENYFDNRAREQIFVVVLFVTVYFLVFGKHYGVEVQTPMSCLYLGGLIGNIGNIRASFWAMACSAALTTILRIRGLATLLFGSTSWLPLVASNNSKKLELVSRGCYFGHRRLRPNR